ncbi:MAG: hypothetical protein V1493_00080 [Candidatus Diapherotrites archaeon]
MAIVKGREKSKEATEKTRMMSPSSRLKAGWANFGSKKEKKAKNCIEIQPAALGEKLIKKNIREAKQSRTVHERKQNAM